jgi:hypothetical protein
MRLPTRQIPFCNGANTGHACLIWCFPINLLKMRHGLRVVQDIKNNT